MGLMFDMPDVGCFLSGGIKWVENVWKFIIFLLLYCFGGCLIMGSFNPTPFTEQHCVAPESTHTSPVEGIFLGHPKFQLSFVHFFKFLVLHTTPR